MKSLTTIHSKGKIKNTKICILHHQRDIRRKIRGDAHNTDGNFSFSRSLNQYQNKEKTVFFEDITSCKGFKKMSTIILLFGKNEQNYVQEQKQKIKNE